MSFIVPSLEYSFIIVEVCCRVLKGKQKVCGLVCNNQFH